ncbi:hypothetical protein RJ639_026598, partial [Escallonia herrerae]
ALQLKSRGAVDLDEGGDNAVEKEDVSNNKIIPQQQLKQPLAEILLRLLIGGQGTISLELLEQAPLIDTIIVPISGLRWFDIWGGIGCQVHKSCHPRFWLLNRGEQVMQLSPKQRCCPRPIPSLMGFELLLGILPGDNRSYETLLQIMKVEVEPSGAIGLAAVLSVSFRENPAWKDCNHVGIILSGGNVDLGVLWDSLSK